MTTENLYTRFMMLAEYCTTHCFQTIEIYCSCYKKLCPECLADHYHENMSFLSIKETVFNFHTEVNETLKLITDFTEKINIKRALEEIKKSRNRRLNLMDSLNDLTVKIRSIICTRHFIPYDSVIEFRKGNFDQKIVELITIYFKKENLTNKKLIDKMVAENKKLNRKFIKEGKNRTPIKLIKKEKEKMKLEITKSSLTISNVKLSSNNKLMSDNIFDSNKENLDPIEYFKISEKSSKNNINNFNSQIKNNKNIIAKTPSQIFCNNNFEPKLETPFKPKKVIISSTFFNNKTKFNYETAHHGFIDSGSKDNIQIRENIRIVCITCRDKFSVMKSETNWRTRCEVCTQNYYH